MCNYMYLFNKSKIKIKNLEVATTNESKQSENLIFKLSAVFITMCLGLDIANIMKYITTNCSNTLNIFMMDILASLLGK